MTWKVCLKANWVNDTLQYFVKFHSYKIDARELSDIDDLCTTLIVDPLLRIKTHKMNIQHLPPSMNTYLESLSIMLQFILDGDLSNTLKNLLNLEKVKKFLQKRPEEAEKHVENHFRHFLLLFHHDSGFTLDICQRYSREKLGGKIIATKKLKKGQILKKLVGIFTLLTTEDLRDFIIQGKNDFSTLYSERKRKSFLCLGPASFLNHNCTPNCRFVVENDSLTYIEVLMDIEQNQELFISYGHDFFDEFHGKCECQTCEKNLSEIFKESPKIEDFSQFSPISDDFLQLLMDIKDNFIKQYEFRERKSSKNKENGAESRIFLQTIVFERFIGTDLSLKSNNLSDMAKKILSNYKFHPRELPFLSKITTRNLVYNGKVCYFATLITPTKLKLMRTIQDYEKSEFSALDWLKISGLNVVKKSVKTIFIPNKMDNLKEKLLQIRHLQEEEQERLQNSTIGIKTNKIQKKKRKCKKKS